MYVAGTTGAVINKPLADFTLDHAMSLGINLYYIFTIQNGYANFQFSKYLYGIGTITYRKRFYNRVWYHNLPLCRDCFVKS